MNHFWRARLRPVLDLRPGLILRDSALLLRLLPVRLLLHCPLLKQRCLAVPALQILLAGQF